MRLAKWAITLIVGAAVAAIAHRGSSDELWGCTMLVLPVLIWWFMDAIITGWDGST